MTFNRQIFECFVIPSFQFLITQRTKREGRIFELQNEFMPLSLCYFHIYSYNQEAFRFLAQFHYLKHYTIYDISIYYHFHAKKIANVAWTRSKVQRKTRVKRTYDSCWKKTWSDILLERNTSRMSVWQTERRHWSSEAEVAEESWPGSLNENDNKRRCGGVFAPRCSLSSGR